MVAASNPAYYARTFNGQMFVGQSTAPQTGIAIPAYNTTTPNFGLWNTSNSVNAVLVKVSLSFVSGTWAPGGLLYNSLTNCGTAVGTGQPVVAFVNGAVNNALLGGGSGSQVRFMGGGANTITTAGSVFVTNGVGIVTAVGAAEMVDVVDGKIIVPPGNMFYLTAPVNSTALVNASLFWYEAPLSG